MSSIEPIIQAVRARLAAYQALTASAPSNRLDGVTPVQVGTVPPVDLATLRSTVLEDFAAPLFRVERGGQLTRLGKRLLNAPLQLFGTPQRHFNDVLRRWLAAWGRVQQSSLELEGDLLATVAAQRDELIRLTERVRRLEASHTAAGSTEPPPPARTRRSDGPLAIGLITRSYPPRQDVGGVARYSAELAAALVSRGHAVHVFTEREPAGRRDEAGVSVHGLATDVVPVVSQVPEADRALRWSIAVAREIDRLARAGTPLDIVECNNWESEGAATLIARLAPVVLRLATPLPIIAREARWTVSQDLDTAIALESWLVMHADAVIYSTTAALEAIGAAHGLTTVSSGPRASIPFGITPRSAAAPGSTRRLLFVGRLEPRKGIDVLLAIVPELLARYADLVVDIVGEEEVTGGREPTARTRFEQRHAARAWRRRCRFHGAVSDAQLEDFYRACTLFVAPSRFESFGLVYLEAMRWGKPVIGCRVGGIPEVVRDGETGLLVPPADAPALAAAVARLLDDPALATRLGTAARTAVEHEFSASRMAEATERFYRDVLAAPRSA